MNLNLRRLLQPGREAVSDEESYDFSALDFAQYTVPEPVRLCYTATPEGGSIRLAFELEAKLDAECARCLGKAVQPVYIEKEYRITANELAEEFPELPIRPDGSLDMKEFAYQELVMEAPPVLLCSEDCEGLCARCGKPAAECHCKPEREVDPRLQGLLKLLEE